MPLRNLGPISSYSAYAGPETGGFNVLPQGTLPEIDERTRAMIGDAGTSPHPLAGMLDVPAPPPAKAGLRLLGPVSEMAGPEMSNQTVVPKGGAPRQQTQEQADEFALYNMMQRVQQARDEQGQRGFLSNALISGQKRVGNAILGLPSMAAEFSPLVAGRRIYNYATGQPQPKIPKLTVDDIGARLAAASPNLTLDQAQQNVAVNEGAREYTHPASTMTGNIAGDIFTIVAARNPFSPGIVAATKSPEKLDAIRRALDLTTPSKARFARRVWASEPMSAIKRALGKSGETGVEAATLAYLHDGDVVKTGAYGAGAQLAGSFALSTIKHPYYSLGTIAGSAVLWQMFKDAIPGGRDRILESAEHATKVATLGTVLGGLAGLFGAGRYRGSTGVLPGGDRGSFAKVFSHKYAEDLPRYAEGVNATLRTGPNSFIEQMKADEKSQDPVLPQVMDKLSTNANAFTSAEIKRLSLAMRKGNIIQEVKRMLENENFAARMGY